MWMNEVQGALALIIGRMQFEPWTERHGIRHELAGDNARRQGRMVACRDTQASRTRPAKRARLFQHRSRRHSIFEIAIKTFDRPAGQPQSGDPSFPSHHATREDFRNK